MPRRLRVRFQQGTTPNPYLLPCANGLFSVSGQAATLNHTGGDFLTRREQPGVVRWFDFDSIAQLGPNAISNPGSSFLDNYGVVPASTGSQVGSAIAVIDTETKCSGSGSLRFNLLANGGGDSAGAWFTNFSPDLEFRVGPGEEVYVQVRVRWDQQMYDNLYTQLVSGNQHGGIKIFDIAAGDDGTNHFFSSASLKTVIQTYKQQRFPYLYGYGAAGNTAAFFESVGGGTDFKMQNEVAACTYSAIDGNNNNPARDTPCFSMVPNEWMTFQLHMKVLSRITELGTTSFDFEAQLWGANENQPSELLIDWDSSKPGYQRLKATSEGSPGVDMEFGKVWLFPYMTEPPTMGNYSAATVWYDELIISTQRIADPGASTNPVLMAIPANTARFLHLFPMTGDMAQPADNPTGASRWAEYGRWHYDPTYKWIAAWGGGHYTTTRDDIFVLRPLTLEWESLLPATLCSSKTYENVDWQRGTWKATATPTGTEHPVGHKSLMWVVAEYDGVVRYLNLSPSGKTTAEVCNLANPYPWPDNIWARIWHFDPESRRYVFISSLFPGNPSDPVAPNGVGNQAYWEWAWFSGCTWDPTIEKAVICGLGSSFGPNKIRFYDPRTDTTTVTTTASVSPSGLATFMVYAPELGKHYSFSYSGGGAPNVIEVTVNSSDITLSTGVTVTGQTGSIPNMTDKAGIWDPVREVVAGFINNGSIWFYKPATKVWSTQVMNLTNNSGIPAPHMESNYAICHDPVNDVYFFASSPGGGDSNLYIWAYRPPASI